MFKVGDYLYCHWPDPKYNGRVFRVLHSYNDYASVVVLLQDGSTHTGEVSCRTNSHIRPATTTEVLRAKLLGL